MRDFVLKRQMAGFSTPLTEAFDIRSAKIPKFLVLICPKQCQIERVKFYFRS